MGAAPSRISTPLILSSRPTCKIITGWVGLPRALSGCENESIFKGFGIGRTEFAGNRQEVSIRLAMCREGAVSPLAAEMQNFSILIVSDVL
jgi:hypothetical protein